MNTKSVVFDDAEVVRISALKGDELETRHADVHRRMLESLPTRCIDEFAKFTQGKVFAIVCGEAALSSLGRTSRSLIGERDELYRAQASLSRRAEDSEQLARGADQKNSITRALGRRWHDQSSLCQLAAAMMLAQSCGVASVLKVQISRESWEKDGLRVPEEWHLPVRRGDELPPELELVATDPAPPPIAPASGAGSDHAHAASAEVDEPKVEEELPVGSDGGDPELELVPLVPKDSDEDPGDGAKGGGDGGGSAAAAVVVVMATVPPDSTIPATVVDAAAKGKDDGLAFLDFDRKA